MRCIDINVNTVKAQFSPISLSVKLSSIREEFAGISLEGYDGRPFVYYYIRILQEDGEMAWSSPIWVAESR